MCVCALYRRKRYIVHNYNKTHVFYFIQFSLFHALSNNNTPQLRSHVMAIDAQVRAQLHTPIRTCIHAHVVWRTMQGECTAFRALRKRIQKQNVIFIEQICYFKGHRHNSARKLSFQSLSYDQE